MLQKASMTKEIRLTVDNSVGILSTITAFLADSGINIEAVVGYGTADPGTAEIMLVVDDTRRATDALKEKRIGSMTENDVIMVEMENKPGALSSMTRLLAQKEINIGYLYATTSPNRAPVKVVLSTDDNEKAYVTLKKSLSV